MGYTKVYSPQSQDLLWLTGEEMKEYGIKFGCDDMAYFVPNDVYDKVRELVAQRILDSEKRLTILPKRKELKKGE